MKSITLLSAGGFLYLLIEIMFRGHTHWTMFFVGGLCFLLIGGLNNWYSWNISIFSQMCLSAVIITTIEFVSGCIVNLWLGLNVWDYSHQPFHVLGQISLGFSTLWFMLSIVAILLDDILRWILFEEGFPEYHLFKKRA